MANYQSTYTGAYIDGVIGQKRSAGYFPTYSGTSAIGNDAKGIYVDAQGIIQASTKTLVTQNSTVQVGNYYTPVYINSSGQPVACSVMPFGTGTKPTDKCLVAIQNDGVMEIGQYIDFHNDTETSQDYTFRINNNIAGKLTFSGYLELSDYLNVQHNNNTYIQLVADNEGGNIRFWPPDRVDHWEMDAYNNHFRIYAIQDSDNTNYTNFTFVRNGAFQLNKGIYVRSNTSSSWIDGNNDWSTDPYRAGVNIVNSPTDGSFYPWVRQRGGSWNYMTGILPNQTSWYVAAVGSTQTNNVYSGILQFHVYARTFSRTQYAYYNTEGQLGVQSASGILYLYSQGGSANRGLYASSGPGYNGAVITVGSNGAVTHHTSDKRLKVPKGYLADQEAKNILSELPVVNFIYKTDVNKYDLEQSGVYAQDLRDILLKYNYKNRGYLQVYAFEDDYDGEEAENADNYFDEKIHQSGNVTPQYTFDITLPEEEVRLYQMDYKALIPLLLKGWQMHEQKIQELEARIQELENK